MARIFAKPGLGNNKGEIKWRDLARFCETAHERSVYRVFAEINYRIWHCHNVGGSRTSVPFLWKYY
jgi:hypothetical protein